MAKPSRSRIAQVKAGRLKAYSVTTLRRSAALPDVPTVAESGVPGFEAVSWYGLWAPRATPREVVVRVNSDVQRVFAEKDFREKFLAPNFLGSIDGNPEQFAAYIKAEAAKWSKVIKDANLKVD